MKNSIEIPRDGFTGGGGGCTPLALATGEQNEIQSFE